MDSFPDIAFSERPNDGPVLGEVLRAVPPVGVRAGPGAVGVAVRVEKRLEAHAAEHLGPHSPWKTWSGQAPDGAGAQPVQRHARGQRAVHLRPGARALGL